MYPPVLHNEPSSGLLLIRLQKAAAPVSIHLSRAVFADTEPIPSSTVISK